MHLSYKLLSWNGNQAQSPSVPFVHYSFILIVEHLLIGTHFLPSVEHNGDIF
jgi:hypothetical protein